MSGTAQEVPISDINFDDFTFFTRTPRTKGESQADFETRLDIADLVEDIKARGQHTAAIFRQTKDGFQIVAGWRRSLACRALKNPVLARIYRTSGPLSPLPDAEAHLIAASENIHRANLTPYEELAIYNRLLNADKDATVKQVAELLKVSGGKVYAAAQVFTFPAVVDALRMDPDHFHKSHAEDTAKYLHAIMDQKKGRPDFKLTETDKRIPALCKAVAVGQVEPDRYGIEGYFDQLARMKGVTVTKPEPYKAVKGNTPRPTGFTRLWKPTWKRPRLEKVRDAMKGELVAVEAAIKKAKG